jgi:hypothetical protein
MSAPGMQSPTPQRRAVACLAALVLAALSPAVTVAIGMSNARVMPYVFIVAAAHALLLGLPAFLYFDRKKRITLLTCIAGAFVIGAAPVGLLDLGFELRYPQPNVHRTYIVIGAFGLFGALGGLVFWSTLRIFGVLPRRAPKTP